MRTTRLTRSSVTAVAGGLLLASAAPLVAADGSALHVACKQVGQIVEVTLLNSGQRELVGQVVLQVEIDGQRSMALIPFKVWGGQKITVQWDSGAPVRGVPTVGIIVDDGAPI
jgi:hypothetical protein